MTAPANRPHPGWSVIADHPGHCIVVAHRSGFAVVVSVELVSALGVGVVVDALLRVWAQRNRANDERKSGGECE